jgi:hypothetical protein
VVLQRGLAERLLDRPLVGAALDAEDLVVSYRNYDLPGYRNSLLLGFRPVRNAKEKV